MKRRNFLFLPLGAAGLAISAKPVQPKRQVIRETLRCLNAACRATYAVEIDRAKPIPWVQQCSNCAWLMDTSQIAERITKGDWEWVE